MSARLFFFFCGDGVLNLYSSSASCDDASSCETISGSVSVRDVSKLASKLVSALAEVEVACKSTSVGVSELVSPAAEVASVVVVCVFRFVFAFEGASMVRWLAGGSNTILLEKK